MTSHWSDCEATSGFAGIQKTRNEPLRARMSACARNDESENLQIGCPCQKEFS